MPKIKVPPLFEKTAAGKDFYWHVNRNWQIRANIPNWLSSFGVSEEIEANVDEKLYNIIDSSRTSYLKGEHINADRKAIAIVAESVLKHTSQYNNIKTLKNMIIKCQCIHDTKDVIKMIGEFCIYRINCFLTLYVVEQEEDNHKNRIYLSSGKLGLPDKGYYSGKAPGGTSVLIAYSKLLEKVGELLEVPYNLNTFVQLEASLAEIIDRVEFDKDIRTTRQELVKQYTSIPFKELWETLEISDNGPIVIGSAEWMRTLNKMFKTWPLENWRVYFTGLLINNFLQFLPPPYDDLYYKLFGKKMKDQLEKISQKRLALTVIKLHLPISLSKEYINLNNEMNSKIKIDILAFVKKLVKAAKNRLDSTDWLEATTIVRAKKKLDAMDIGIGYPDKWPCVSGSDELNPENLLENIITLGKNMTLQTLETEGKHSERSKKWDDPTFAVNAYYYNQGNGLIMPAGILQWPFYKIDAPLGWNHGAIGCVISHEMTHAFDMDGKNYDERGYMEPWWTVRDNRKYNKKTKELVKIYSDANYMEHKVNGSLTLSENIADLGGMGIALEALKDELEGISAAERKKALRNFFTAFAISWRTKERRQKAYQALLIDKHSPATLRVNLVVSQFDEWYEAFDIEENNLLFRPPDSRIRIF